MSVMGGSNTFDKSYSAYGKIKMEYAWLIINPILTEFYILFSGSDYFIILQLFNNFKLYY